MKTIILLLIMMGTMADQPRQVLLFYTAGGEAKWKSQMQILEAAQKGMRERDIEVKTFASSSPQADQWKKWKVGNAEAFTFILVGRDGGEKFRSHDVVPAEKLFGLIDAMPMRKREMNEK